MCGIAGFVGREPGHATSAPEVLDRMCRVIAHRGPDDQGTLVEGRVALGMRRLSIIDVGGGHQPISGENGAVTIVFNGEIYNYQDLQRDLQQKGHTFQTQSDTETIVHAYEEYGAECLSHLRGMFAFAIWDRRGDDGGRFFAARDRVGKKPFYYTVTPGGTLVFGSELKCLLEHPEVTPEINPAALNDYLSLGYVPEPVSIFRHIDKLPPGHYLTFHQGQLSVQQYWDFRYEEVEERSEAEYVEELRALLDEAVRIRLISEVPLGAFLSGGVDSSTVVGLMARHTNRPVKTFSIGFHEDSFNELKYARVAAEHFGTDHHEFIVTPDICHVVDDLVWHFDEPFSDPSAIPTFMVSKLARQYVTVALSGDGGDELFGGYTRYLTDLKRGRFARLPKVLRRGMMQPLSYRLPHGLWGRNYLHNVALDSLERYADSVSVFTNLNRRDLYTPDFQEQVATDSAARFKEYAARVKTGQPLDYLLYIDSKTYLPGDILTKVDRMSMAVSLEARVPLLDHKLIEFVTRIPASRKVRGPEGKHIFKRAVRGLVPDAILDRPKQGFGMPIQKWINHQLRERIYDTLTDVRSARGYVNQGYVKVLLDEHRRGRRDHAKQLWTLFMLELWHRKYERPAFVPAAEEHFASRATA